MLKEIYCDKFISYGKIRDRIVFNEGLNVIEGNDTGDNSIGKSTFLMCIDFAFGGNDYIDKLRDLQKHVQSHAICFAFQFDKMYYFRRSTDEKETIYLCDKTYLPTGEKWDRKKEFLPFLKKQYGISNPFLSFRQIVSRFLRIYNRENLNELLPLRSHDNESEKTSLEELIKLFDLFALIEDLVLEEKRIREQKDIFGKAQDYRFIPRISDREYKTNVETIARLEQEKEELAEKSDKGLLDLDSEKAERTSQIKSEISALKRKRTALYRQLNLYKKDNEYEPTFYQRDFSELESFFPNANLKVITEIEDFHRKLSILLRAEFKTACEEIWSQINLLSEAITSYELELNGVQTAKNVSKVVLTSYASIDKQLDALRRINEYHLQKKQLDDEVKRITKDLEDKKILQITRLLSLLNSKMKELNASIYDEGTNPPTMVVTKSSTYTFETPDDQGTGTKYKGMIILDIAILALTCLPALVHDSVMFANMSINRIDRTFQLYAQMNKQVFVAIDKTVQYSSSTASLIESHRVLSLSPNGNELFGEAWNKKSSEE